MIFICGVHSVIRVAEASRADYRNLYVFIQEHAAKTDARFDRLEIELRKTTADLRAIIKSSHESLDRRWTVA